jgi:exodeoxyribonuclease-5
MGDDTRMGFIANGEQLRLVRITKTETLYGFEFVHARVKFTDYEEIGEVEVILLTEVLMSESPSLPRDRMKALFFAIEEDYMHERNKKKRYEAILSDKYFNALQVKYANAVTCHKSQGGQWKHVYIDQGYLNEEMLDKSYYRWLYTALTRATEQAYLVNFADEFFG